MPRALAGILDPSYLLIRSVKVSHRCKPSVVDGISEDGSSPLSVRVRTLAVHMAYRALCQDVRPLETASLMFPSAD